MWIEKLACKVFFSLFTTSINGSYQNPSKQQVMQSLHLSDSTVSLKRKAEESEDKNIEVPKFDITYKDLMAMVVCYTLISKGWCIYERTALGTLL